MQRWRWIAVIALVAAGVAGGLAYRASRALRVGVVLPLTGPDAPIGLGMRNAIRMAADEVNGRGGIQGRHVVLVEQDDQSDATRAAAAAKALADDSSTLAVIGAAGGEAYRALQPVLGERKVPFLVGGVIDRDVSDVGLGLYPAEFSLLPFGTTAMEAAARHAWDLLGARRFVYARDESPLARVQINQFRVATSQLIKVAQTGEEVLNSDADIAGLVAKLKAAPPDYLFFAGRPERAARLLRQLRAAGVGCPFQHAWREPSRELIELAGGDAQGAIAVFPAPPDDSFPEGRAFLSAYAANRFPAPPSRFGVFAYAEAQALFEAMDRSFLRRPSIAGALRREQLQTALGPIRFTFVGSTYQSIHLYRVANGGWSPFSTYRQGKLEAFAAR